MVHPSEHVARSVTPLRSRAPTFGGEVTATPSVGAVVSAGAVGGGKRSKHGASANPAHERGAARGQIDPVQAGRDTRRHLESRVRDTVDSRDVEPRVVTHIDAECADAHERAVVGRVLDR